MEWRELRGGENDENRRETLRGLLFPSSREPTPAEPIESVHPFCALCPVCVPAATADGPERPDEPELAASAGAAMVGANAPLCTTPADELDGCDACAD